MAERLIERAGGFASHLGLLAGRGIRKAVLDIREGAQQRAETQRAARAANKHRREQELLAVEAALPLFRAKLADALGGYVPVVSQVDVDATDWRVPHEAAELFQAELVRIQAIITVLSSGMGYAGAARAAQLPTNLRKAQLDGRRSNSVARVDLPNSWGDKP